ncbi:MATE family efflux transporter, partial [Streptococcus suis]|uniref:MATE family efflux transporter n=1 Tax=Streptococcus suis TaxID=1307 RepID=UPI00211E37CC
FRRRWRETAYSRCTSHPFSRVVMTTRSIGAGDRESLTFHVRQALVLSVGVGLLFGLLSFIFGRQMLVLMGAEMESLAGAQAFFYWVGGLTILQALMTILGTILRASGE